MGDQDKSRGVKGQLFPSTACSPTLRPSQPCLPRNHGMGDTQPRISKGQTVYVYNEGEAWRKAVVLEVDTVHDAVTVTMDHNEQVTSFQLDEVLVCWEKDVEMISDLTHVNPVHEATILSCLHKRFEAGVYYTNAGNIVVAINPFCHVPHLYTLDQIQAYHNRQQGLPPHIYPVVEEAYRSLVRELGHINQSIVISGESGAGKTESAKHLLRYLTIVANPATETWSVDDKGFQIEQRVVDSNPILEAFGNAATMRNENSSRFGKFIQLQFLRSGRIQGGAIHTYLLEKTRLMGQAEGENNFHVFYQMTRVTGQDDSYSDWVKEMKAEMENTTFLCAPHNQDCSDNTELKDTLDAMSRIGLSDDSQKQVFQVLLAILYLGNLTFVPVNEDHSDLERDQVSGQALERSSELLGLTSDLLSHTLLHRSLQAGGHRRHSVFLKPVTITEAANRRATLAMLLYSRLFDWLVGFINSRIRAEVFDNVIGLLDIYGFEVLPTNSLEQLCINYANERLHQHYVAHFLKNLQREYRDECLQWVPIDYTDNRPCLNLLDGRLSIFSLLNEEVYLNRKSDAEALRDRLVRLSADSQSCGQASRLAWADCPSFMVQHYAGDVVYCVSDLVSKNKDNVPADLVGVMMGSASPFMHSLFSSYTEPHSPSGKKRKTVLAKFKGSLDVLMTSLGQSDVHYIRCLRPNTSHCPTLFQSPYVLRQLRACGTLESVSICRKGFPARMLYSDFLQRYSLILRSEYRLPADRGDSVEDADDDDDDEEKDSTGDPLDMSLQQQSDFPVSPNSSISSRTPTPPNNSSVSRQRGRSTTGGGSVGEEGRVVCCSILQTVGSSQGRELHTQCGLTKVFLTQQQLEDLECARWAVLHHSATCLQSAWRGVCCRRLCRRLVAASTIGRAWRGFLVRHHFLCLKQAAVVIQRAWVTLHTRRRFVALRQSVRVVQRAWRSVKTRQQFVALRQSVRVVQRAWRTVQVRRDFVGWRRAALVIQRVWRSVKTRQQFVALRRAALVIQGAWAMARARRQFLHVKRATLLLQRGRRRCLHHQRHITDAKAKSVTLTLQPLEEKERPLTLQQPWPSAAEESAQSPPDVSLHSCDCQQHSASTPLSSHSPEQWPACDGNLSDDSGVIVHEPLSADRPPVAGRKKGVWLNPEGREAGEDGWWHRRQRLKLSVERLPRLQDTQLGDGIVSRYRIPPNGVRFHTRASVLPYGHVINRWQLPCGLLDVLTELPYGGRGVGSPVDP